ncbi:hypothetical protein ACFQ9J_33855 [Streptomyces sp. NPDC056529]|uniref:hypothetical protein n=1 Tax=Streptomyces sp. NPDC056529 TaxID=3345855 RepID=UPI00367561CE
MVLALPAGRGLPLGAPAGGSPEEALAGVIGRTRTALLHALDGGPLTTTDLARTPVLAPAATRPVPAAARPVPPTAQSVPAAARTPTGRRATPYRPGRRAP